MLNVYVVGQSKDLERARRAMSVVRLRGHAVTFDWVAEIERVGAASPPGAQRRQSALAGMRGVNEADVLVFLHPPLGMTSTGCWWELGFWTALWLHRCGGDEVAMTAELAWRTLFLPAPETRYGHRSNPGPCIFDTLVDLVVQPERDRDALESFLLTADADCRTRKQPPTVKTRPKAAELADALGFAPDRAVWDDLVARARELREIHWAVRRRAERLDLAPADAADAPDEVHRPQGSWSSTRGPAPQEEKAGQVAPAPLSPPESAPALGGIPDVAVEETPSLARPKAGGHDEAHAARLEAVEARCRELAVVIEQLRNRIRGLELAVQDGRQVKQG